MINAVIYARFSSHNQTEQSIEGQVRVCTEYARAHGMSVSHVYADRAISGRTDARPEFQQMIRDATRRKFEAVIVYRTDRFARNKYDSAIYKQQLRKFGVAIHYAAEAIPAGPEGIILESLMEGLAEYYSAELAQKIKRGIRESAMKANASGGQTPFGYILKDKKYVVDPFEAEGVRMIFDMYIAQRPIHEILNRLNDLGYQTKQHRPFRSTSLEKILKNRKYIGVFRLADIEIEGGVPAIISVDTFAAAQAEAERRRRSKKDRAVAAEYLLADRLFCGYCGSRMVGVSGTGRNGTSYGYYYCPNHRGKNKSCKLTQIRSEWLEDRVVAATLETILAEEKVSQIAKKCYKLQLEEYQSDSKASIYRAELEKTKRAIANLVRALEEGTGSLALTERVRDLETTQNELERRIKEERAKDFLVTEEQIAALLRRYADAPKEEIIRTFVARVELTNDELTIWYNLTGPGGGLETWTGSISRDYWTTMELQVEHLAIRAGWAVLKIKRGRP